MTGGNDPSLYKTSKDGPILGFDLEMLKRKYEDEEKETKKELGLNPKTNKPLTVPTPAEGPPPSVDNNLDDNKTKPAADAPDEDASPQGNLSDDDFNEMWGEQ